MSVLQSPETDQVAALEEPDGFFWRGLSWLGDRLNPILVKETRQALKSRQFTLWFGLLLFACWVTTIGAVLLIGPSIYYVPAGRMLLFAYFVILALPLVIVAPFATYRSLVSEHEESTRDVLEVSSLTPRQLINGKLASAAVQAIVYLSAVAPCIAFTYLLRGVTLGQIFLLIFYALMTSIGLSMLGLLIAAQTRRKQAQIVSSVVLAGGLFSCFSGLLGVAGAILQIDPNDLVRSEFFAVNSAALCAYATTFALVHALAVAMVNYSSANRSTGVRFAMFVQSAVFVAWISGLIALVKEREIVLFGLCAAGVYWTVAGAFLGSESPQLSHRVRRSLPQSFLGRLFLTAFNPGGGAGYIFSTTNLAAACLVMAVVSIAYDTPDLKDILAVAALVPIYMAFILGVGRLLILAIRKVAEVSLVAGGLIQIFVLVAACSTPYLAAAASDQLRRIDPVILGAASPIWAIERVTSSGFRDTATEITYYVTICALAVSIYAINLYLAGHEARQLRIAAPQRVIEDDLELHPQPEPQATNPWGDRPQPIVETGGETGD